MGPAVGGMQRDVEEQENSPPPPRLQPAPDKQGDMGGNSHTGTAVSWADGFCSVRPEDLPTCFPKELMELCFSRQLLSLESGDGACLVKSHALL